jgi:hypothetical protein
VSTFSRSQSSHRRVPSTHRSRPVTRFPLNCEGLESRQLLSIAPGGSPTGAAAPLFMNPAQVLTLPVVVNVPAGSFATIQFEFGSFSGFSAIQFNIYGGGGYSSFFGTVPAAASAPSAPAYGPGLGSLTGLTNTGLTSGSASSGSNIGNLLPATTPSTTNLAITPLNPNVTSISTTPGLNPVYVVPPPIQPVAVHMTASASPVTNIAFSTLLSSAQEQPPSMTHFGQDLDFRQRSLWTKPAEVVEPESLIDWVEPAKPVAPADGEKIDGGQPVDPAAAPKAAPVQPGLNDRDVAALFDLGEHSSHGGAIGDAAAQSDDQPAGAYYSWSLSTVFGATIVAAGGYQLAIREADRFKARWTPRWIGAERPTKRKSGPGR